jgi:hypothetical protein
VVYVELEKSIISAKGIKMLLNWIYSANVSKIFSMLLYLDHIILDHIILDHIIYLALQVNHLGINHVDLVELMYIAKIYDQPQLIQFCKWFLFLKLDVSNWFYIVKNV